MPAGHAGGGAAAAGADAASRDAVAACSLAKNPSSPPGHAQVIPAVALQRQALALPIETPSPLAASLKPLFPAGALAGHAGGGAAAAGAGAAYRDAVAASSLAKNRNPPPGHSQVMLVVALQRQALALPIETPSPLPASLRTAFPPRGTRRSCWRWRCSGRR